MERLKNFLENVFCGDRLKNFCEDLFFFGDRLKNFCEDLFFFFFLESTCTCVLGLESVCPRKGCPWPRIFFVSLASASSLVSSLHLWSPVVASQKERAPIAVNRLGCNGCTTYELLRLWLFLLLASTTPLAEAETATKWFN